MKFLRQKRFPSCIHHIHRLQLTRPPASTTHNHTLPHPQPRHRIPNHLIHNSLGALPLLHHRRRLAHQKRPRIIHHLVINVIAQRLEIVFHGYDPLARQLLDLARAVLLPIPDVLVIPNAQRPAREDDGADIIVEPRGADSFLMGLGRARLLAQDEAGADPDGASAQHEGRGDALTVEEPARGDDLDLIARHGAFPALDHFGDGGDEDGGGDVAGVAAAFAALGADHVGADVEAFGDVFGVADHVHVEDAGFVEALDDVDGGHADGGDEEFSARVDDDGDEVVEFTFCVVVASWITVLAVHSG